MSVGLIARAGFATAMICSPAAEMTCTPEAVRSTVSVRFIDSPGHDMGERSLSKPLTCEGVGKGEELVLLVSSGVVLNMEVRVSNTYSLA